MLTATLTVHLSCESNIIDPSNEVRPFTHMTLKFKSKHALYKRLQKATNMYQRVYGTFMRVNSVSFSLTTNNQ